jgi:predicted DNA-binding transcriptional regulator YafY
MSVSRDLTEGLNRALLLANLLYSRRAVSLKTIMETCGLPERSAYRYINRLSEANVPIHYDRDARLYRLAEGSGFRPDLFVDQELFLIVLALRVLRSVAGDGYGVALCEIERKLVACAELPLEKLLPLIESRLSGLNLDSDLSEFLTASLISAAIELRCCFDVECGDGDNRCRIAFEKPALVFDQDWRVQEGGKDGGEAPRLRDIGLVRWV